MRPVSEVASIIPEVLAAAPEEGTVTSEAPVGPTASLAPVQEASMANAIPQVDNLLTFAIVTVTRRRRSGFRTYAWASEAQALLRVGRGCEGKRAWVPPELDLSKTLNEAPPPGRSSTHALPPWSSAN